MSIGSNISDQIRHGSDTLEPNQLAAAAKKKSVEAAHAVVDVSRDVAHMVGEQASAVAEQAKEHLTSMVSHAKDELAIQVEQRGKQAAGGVRSLVRGAERKVHQYTPGRRRRGPRGVIQHVTAFARRRPVMFLLIVAAAGVGVAQLIRVSAARSEDASRRTRIDAGVDETARSNEGGSANGDARPDPVSRGAASNGTSRQHVGANGGQPG